MSEKKFHEAKGNLAFSQSLIDRLRAPQLPQQTPVATSQTEVPQQVPVEAPQGPQNAPEQPQQEESGIIKAVKDILAPIVKKVEDLLSKKDEPKETVLKIDATAEPKDEKDDSK